MDEFGDDSRPWTNGLVSRVSPAPRLPVGLRAVVYSRISTPLSSPGPYVWDMFPTVVSSMVLRSHSATFGIRKACNRRERDTDEAEARRASRNWKGVEAVSRSR